jgi:uncharacterized membrane protein
MFLPLGAGTFTTGIATLLSGFPDAYLYFHKPFFLTQTPLEDDLDFLPLLFLEDFDPFFPFLEDLDPFLPFL